MLHLRSSLAAERPYFEGIFEFEVFVGDEDQSVSFVWPTRQGDLANSAHVMAFGTLKIFKKTRCRPKSRKSDLDFRRNASPFGHSLSPAADVYTKVLANCVSQYTGPTCILPKYLPRQKLPTRNG
jgi:hypothetical protein